MLIAVVAGLQLLGTASMYKRRKELRRQAVAGFASRSGLQHAGEDADGSLDGQLAVCFPHFPPFLERGRRGCENVLSGRWQGLPVKEADFWYMTVTDIPPPVVRSLKQFSFVIVDLAVTVSRVLIQPKDQFTRLVNRLGLHRYDFGSGDFPRAFQVMADGTEGGRFAVKLIDADMKQWLLSTDAAFAFEVQGSNLLVWCRLLPATRLAELLDAAKGFTDHIPGIVRAEYGTGEQIQAASAARTLQRGLHGAEGKVVPARSTAVPSHLVQTLTSDSIDNVWALAFSPDERLLAVGGSSVGLWDPATGQHLRTLSGHTGMTQAVAFSPDGRLLAASKPLWDPATREHLRTLKAGTSSVRAVAFSPDGRLLATGAVSGALDNPAQLLEDNTVRLWDPVTREHLRNFKAGTSSIQGLAFSPDGRLLATGFALDDTVEIWDPTTRQHLHTLESDDSVAAVAFSPDGSLLATASVFGHAVQLWS